MDQERANLLLTVLNYVMDNGWSAITAEDLAIEMSCSELDAQSYLEDLVADGYLMETSPLSYDLLDLPRERAHTELLKFLNDKIDNL